MLRKNLVIWAVIAALVGLVIIAGIYKYVSSVYVANYESPAETTTQVKNEQVVAVRKPSGSDIIGSYVTLKNLMKDYTGNFKANPLKVQWNKGAVPLTAKEDSAIFGKIRAAVKLQCVQMAREQGAACRIGEDDIAYIYKAGTVTVPENLKGTTVYYVFVPVSEMGVSYPKITAIFNPTDDAFVEILQEEIIDDGTSWGYSVMGNRWFNGVISATFDELKEPATLTIPGQDSTLVFKENMISDNPADGFSMGYSGPSGWGGIFNLEKNILAKKFADSEIAFTDPTYGPVYYRDQAYHLVMPDGTIKKYDLRPYFAISDAPTEAEKTFYRESFLADITWTGGLDNSKEKYQISGMVRYGCGGTIKPCTSVVNSYPWFNEKNLAQIGATKKGEPVYELKDKLTNSYYKEIFDYGYAGSKYQAVGMDYTKVMEQLDEMSDAEQMKDFAQDQPLFFWKDYMGHWRVFKKSRFQTMAECGKPVIYLYPEKETNVRVTVEPNGGLKITEPEYPVGGWVVTAKPDGTLINLPDKKSYPYLFWEGYGFDYVKPEYGFVMARQDVSNEMARVLGQLGLNKKETTDFMEFWEPKLKEKPYVFVTFLPQNQFNKMAPLSVEPKADTIIRVFMDYTSLEKPIKVLEPKIKTPVRTGFTVVEWGGVIHK